MKVDKKNVLKRLSFGKRIAEEEINELSSYFVETDQWQQIFDGDIDVVYGAKGAGKSAIYSLLISRKDVLFDRGILAVAAENPRGAPAFKDIVSDPPASESEFRNLWKVYFLCLVGGTLQEYGIQSDKAKKVISRLEEANLLPQERGLSSILRSVVDYVRRRLRAEAIEGGLQMDPLTGAPTLTGKISLREPNAAERKLGQESADTLLQFAHDALEHAGVSIWLLLDRLDVAFADSDELERNALQALFRVYLDMQGLSRIFLKIFLRNDIWRRITSGGFREASHITRAVSISWKDESLLNLVVRRALRNTDVVAYYGLDSDAILQNVNEQENFFYRMFPAKVDLGVKKSTTFDWMLSRTRDGTRTTAPRELIHLLSATRDVQQRRIEMGFSEPPEDTLFERQSLREALPEVSKVRLEQTLYAEYPQLKSYLQKLEGEKTQQSIETLAAIWEISRDEALIRANQLVEIGFFERRGTKDTPVFWVPFLYRGALEMVQGSAGTSNEEEEDEE